MEFDATAWERVEAILDLALDAPPEERSAVLDRECGIDEALRRQVERLLKAADGADDFLEAPVEAWIGEDAEPVAAPERAGPYRLCSVIGRGGMGEVYLAERADGQFEQKVAIKLFRHGPNLREVRQRFLQERQILARLEHPNIARLIDGGVTDDGRPYFALEYIEGKPITAYADERCLSVRRRVDLFLAVCDAVEYAHRALIVHRDLKPNNILAADDGSVKLLDFGIAKLIGDERGEADATRATTRVMTPEYASPEQVKGEAVTTATDVYGLGLVLFELLSGHRPYRISRSTPYEIERAVVHTEPRRPSRVVMDTAEVTTADGTTRITPRDVVRARGTTVRALRRVLGGDLDAILEKALRKDPRERYPSAEALHRDLAAWSGGLPVQARIGSSAYRLRKYVQRNRVALTAALLIAGSLVGGLAVAVWQTREARRSEAKARAVSEFLVEEMIGASTPEASFGREVTVREVLDATSHRIEGAFDGQPDLAASVRTAVGRSYSSLGLYDDAHHHLETAARILVELRGENDPETLRADAAFAEVLAREGAYDQAQELLGSVLNRQRIILGPDHLDTLVTQGLENDLRNLRGEYLAAENGFRYTLDRLRAQHPGAWREALRMMTGLVRSLDLQRKNAQSESVCAETLRLQRRHLGEAHPDFVRTLTLMGNIQRRLERPADSRVTLLEALETSERVFGTDHPETLDVLRRLGAVHWALGQAAESQAAYEDALRRAERGLGPDNPRTISLALNRAVILSRRGRTEDSLSAYVDVEARARTVLGEMHPTAIRATSYRGNLLWSSGRQDEGREVLGEAIEIRHRMSARRDADATALNDFAWFLLTCPVEDLQDPEAALPLARRAVEISDGRQVEFLDTLAAAQHRTGDLDGAIETQWRLFDLPDSVYRYGLERAMVRYLEEAGDPAEVERFLLHNLERRRTMREPDDPLIGFSHLLLGRYHLAHDRPDRAEDHYRQAVEQYRKRLPADDWRVGRATGELGDAILRQGRFDDAEELVLRSIEILAADPRASTGDRGEAIGRALLLYEGWGKPEEVEAWKSRTPE